MNIERLSQLGDALERGAPGVAFCVGAMRSTVQLALAEGDLFDRQTIVRECEQKNLREGDICCDIAGYSIQLFDASYPLDKAIFTDPYAQECMIRYALELLDLPWIYRGPRWDCGHDLFDPTHAPDECAPAQAAQAIRRLIAGETPWASPPC